MNTLTHDRIYFIGIGGIGMSALAKWLKSRGKEIAGFDRAENTLTQQLIAQGCKIHYSDDVLQIPTPFKDPKETLVVYTPAIQSDHKELTFFRENKFIIKKRSEILGCLTDGHYTIAIAGTHGKTTTSAMIAHLLNGLPRGVNAFIGGIMSNYDSNLLISNKEAPIVVEADEFDRSFLQLSPNYTVVTSIDPDHLDIYGDIAELKNSFTKFVNKTKAEGKILMSSQVGIKTNNLEHTTYDIHSGDIIAEELRIVEGAHVFTYRKGKITISDLVLYMPGYHNVMNALAAITVAIEMGLSDKMIKTRLKTFKGVKRRFEYIIQFGKTLFIDDYAHHPAEIDAMLQALKKLYPKRKITMIFQPHLYSRTRDFMNKFAESLSRVDELYLLPIYPAREKPIEGVSSEELLERVKLENKWICTKKELPHLLMKRKPDVLLTAGAGDIDKEVPKLANLFKENE